MSLEKSIVDAINKRVDYKYPKEKYGNTIRNDYRLILKEGAKIALKFRSKGGVLQ